MDFREIIFEPRYDQAGGPAACSDLQQDAGNRISAYLGRCVEDARDVFGATPPAATAQDADPVDSIIDVLLHAEFNHQAKGRLSHLLPDLRRRIGMHVAGGTPIPLFLSYNGGYRAATRPDLAEPLGFEASTAEFLLFHMIARLLRRLRPLHPPGLIFHIVLNNGVAHYVNDIPVARTEAYARDLQDMIDALGGGRHVRLLVQSHPGDFARRLRAQAIPPAPSIEPEMHRNIERFLGRPCTEAEARMRLGRYAPAEAAWWQELRAIIDAADGVRLLQVASPDFLSFRPFPGGATRAQTGRIGFRFMGAKVVPAMITTRTRAMQQILSAPALWPLARPIVDA